MGNSWAEKMPAQRVAALLNKARQANIPEAFVWKQTHVLRDSWQLFCTVLEHVRDVKADSVRARLEPRSPSDRDYVLEVCIGWDDPPRYSEKRGPAARRRAAERIELRLAAAIGLEVRCRLARVPRFNDVW